MDWSGIGSAPIFERGVTFGAGGHFKCSLVRCLLKDSQQSGTLFIVESKILESSHPTNPIGSNATWFQSFKNKQVAFSAIKAFVVAACGLDPVKDKARIEAELAPHLPIMMPRITDAGELDGRTYSVTTVPTFTKTGHTFLRHDFAAWSPPEGWAPQPTPEHPPFVDPAWLAASQARRGAPPVGAPAAYGAPPVGAPAAYGAPLVGAPAAVDPLAHLRR